MSCLCDWLVVCILENVMSVSLVGCLCPRKCHVCVIGLLSMSSWFGLYVLLNIEHVLLVVA